jgi:hypothetical protein
MSYFVTVKAIALTFSHHADLLAKTKGKGDDELDVVLFVNMFQRQLGQVSCASSHGSKQS